MGRSIKLMLFAAMGAPLLPLQAQASGNLAAGSFAQAVQTGQSEQDVGICRLMTGPRDGPKGNQFVLTLGDSISTRRTWSPGFWRVADGQDS